MLPWWQALLWLLAILAVIGLGCFGAMQLVYAEERWREQEERERRAAARHRSGVVHLFGPVEGRADGVVKSVRRPSRTQYPQGGDLGRAGVDPAVAPAVASAVDPSAPSPLWRLR